MADSVLTVLVPCFNQELFIDQCITSLLDQSEKNFKIVVSDNRSTDGSLAVLNKYKGFICLTQPPVHLPATEHFNFLFSQAVTPWATLLCCDDWVSHDFVKTLSVLGLKNPSASLVRAGWSCVGPQGKIISVRRLWSCPRRSSYPKNFVESIVGPKSPLISWAANVQLFKDVGYFDPKVDICDWTAMLALSRKGDFVTTHKAIAFYRVDYRPGLQSARIKKQLLDCIYIVNVYLLPYLSRLRRWDRNIHINKLSAKISEMYAQYLKLSDSFQDSESIENSFQEAKAKLRALS